MNKSMSALTVGGLVIGALGSSGAVPAIADDGFYKNKNLKMIVRSGPGVAMIFMRG